MVRSVDFDDRPCTAPDAGGCLFKVQMIPGGQHMPAVGAVASEIGIPVFQIEDAELISVIERDGITDTRMFGCIEDFHIHNLLCVR